MKLKKRVATVWIFVWFLPSLTIALLQRGGWIRDFSVFDLPLTLHPMSWPHLLGCDAFGRDVLLSVMRASVTSSLFAIAAVGVSCILGVIIGTSIALAPPVGKNLALQTLNGFLAFPTLLFALGWAAIRGPGWNTLLLALLLGSVPIMIRFVYVRTDELLKLDYVSAARSMGANRTRIFLRHLLPEVGDLCRVKLPGLFAQALIAEATLSFLGIGAPIGKETWGSLLLQGKDYLIEAPHLAFGTGLPLVLTVISLQLFSESLTHSEL